MRDAEISIAFVFAKSHELKYGKRPGRPSGKDGERLLVSGQMTLAPSQSRLSIFRGLRSRDPNRKDSPLSGHVFHPVVAGQTEAGTQDCPVFSAKANNGRSLFFAIQLRPVLF
jgi:hypothetical protein